MKKILLGAAIVAAFGLVSCGGSQKQEAAAAEDSVAAPAYTVLEKDTVDLSKLAVDSEGYIVSSNRQLSAVVH